MRTFRRRLDSIQRLINLVLSALSYMAGLRLVGPMRRLGPIDLEYAFLLFLLVIPMGYFVVQLLFAALASG